MKIYQSWLLSAVVIALITQLRTAELNAEVGDLIRQAVTDKNLFKNSIDRVLYTLGNSAEMNTFEVKRYIGSGAGCVLVEIQDKTTNRNYLAKVVLDVNDKYEICNKENDNEEINRTGIREIKSFKKYITYKGSDYLRSFYSCILILEKAENSIDKKFDLLKRNETSQLENSKSLLRFFARAVYILAELHFKANTLHGDINPSNILVRYKETGDHNYDLFPVIIDFGLRLENPTRENISDKQLRYAEGYRVPEMVEVMSKAGKSDDNLWYKNWKNYKFSKDFTEDVYALGKTIEKVIEIQKDYIYEDYIEITILKKIARQMIAEKEFDYFLKEQIVKIRPNMKEVLAMFIKEMRGCYRASIKAIDGIFLTQAEALLKSLKQNIIVI